MRAGTLRHRINVVNKIESKNNIGESIYTEEDVFGKEVAASIRELQTTEKYFDSSTLSNTELILSMRYSSKINERQLIKYEDRNYEIVKINNMYGRNKQLLIAIKGFDFE